MGAGRGGLGGEVGAEGTVTALVGGVGSADADGAETGSVTADSGAGAAAGGVMGGVGSAAVEAVTGRFATGAVGLMAGVSEGVGLGRADD